MLRSFGGVTARSLVRWAARAGSARPATGPASFTAPTPRSASESSSSARTCVRLAPNDGGNDADAVTQATHMTLRMLAERIEQLTAQINELNQRLARLVEHHAPQLLEPVGIGPDRAVPLLITMGDNPERLNTEASFAVLCAVSPIEYSSGRRHTRRLDYGGDRQANAALHRIVFTRLRHDPRTQAYYERRTQVGKTRREQPVPRTICSSAVFHLVRPVLRAPRYRGGWEPAPGERDGDTAGSAPCT